MQPLLPLLADRDTIAQIPIQEHLMGIVAQPPVHLTRQHRILAGMTDKHPCHSSPTHGDR